ncbi:histidine kinase [bacterium]|nr:histidine kinase [bacterium]
MSKHILKNINTSRLKILLIPLMAIILMFAAMLLMLLFDYKGFDEMHTPDFKRMGFGLFNTTLTLFIFYYILNWMNNHPKCKFHWFVRILIDIVIIVANSALFIFVSLAAIEKGIFEPFPLSKSEFVYIMPLVMNALTLVMLEMILSIEARNKLSVQIAQMEKEQINAKYGALKDQIDHHFLFNNLSVLSSIIYEDTEKADHFIQDFASIYRYVLCINKRNLVTVEEELDFIDKYLNLYKYRFEEGFNYTLQIDKEHSLWMIPPLTLQIIVENVIKHNIISKHQPLHLEIVNKGNLLIVKNTLQIKTEQVISTQTGQINLVEKYRLLNQDLPLFESKENLYIATVPLILADEIGQE